MLALIKPQTCLLLLFVWLPIGCGGKAQAGTQRSGAGGEGGQGEMGGADPGPATHVSECEALCARSAEVGCTGGDTPCVLACATVTGFSSCQSQIQAWLDCAKEAEMVCDSSGVPTFAGCDLQLALAAACAASAPAPKAVQKSCGSYCDQLEASGCTATTPLGDCRQACGIAGMVVSTCQSKFIDYVNCAIASGESCDENGQINASICTAQQLVYAGCLFSEVGQAGMLAGAGGTSSR